MKGFSLAEALSHNARRKNTNPTRLIVGSFLGLVSLRLPRAAAQPQSSRGGASEANRRR